MSMRDTIYRDEAVEICERWRQRAKEHQDRDGWYMADILLRFMKEMPSADKSQGWIPCSERLPSNSDDVLITIKGDDFVASGTCAGYHSERWWYLGEDGEITDVPITAEVLAWMPLPEPWKGVDDEDN